MKKSKQKSEMKVNLYFNSKGESLQKIMEKNVESLAIRQGPASGQF